MARPTQSSNLQFGWIDEEFDSAMNDTRTIFEGLKDTVEAGEGNETPAWEQQVREKIANTKAKFNNVLDSLESNVTEGIQKLPTQEQDRAGAFFGSLLDKYDTVIDKVKKAVTDVWNWVKATASRIWSTVKVIWSMVAVFLNFV